MPKNNGYQSLHTTLLGPYGTPIEMQIRTKEMHRIAEAGLASHWLYKESGTSLTDLQTKTHQWLQNLLEIHMESGSSTEFLEHLRVDLFPDEVYVLTPKGDIMSLPYQATCVDFAYAVHTDIGNQTVAAKLNHELVPLRKTIKTGDRVEIITTDNAKPNSSWLDFVVTAKARHGIRHRLKTKQHDEAVHLGSQILAGALRALDPTNTGLALNSWEEIAPKFADKSKNQILSDIGLGKTLAIAVARSLLLQIDEKKIAENTENSPEQLLIRGSEGMTLEFGMCCTPIPGDPIIGHMKKGTGLIIHTHDCKTLSTPGTQNVKFLDVAWSDNTDKMFTVKISLIVSDAQGVLAKVASEITKTDSNIQSAIAEPGDSSAYSSMIFTIQVENRMHLATVMRSLRKIPAVIRINRLKSH